MTEDQYVGFGLAILGALLLLLNAWMTYTDRRANAIVQQASSSSSSSAVLRIEVPAETVDRMRAYVQAEAWIHSQNPIHDRLAEERFRKQLTNDERPGWLP